MSPSMVRVFPLFEFITPNEALCVVEICPLALMSPSTVRVFVGRTVPIPTTVSSVPTPPEDDI